MSDSYDYGSGNWNWSGGGLTDFGGMPVFEQNLMNNYFNSDAVLQQVQAPIGPNLPPVGELPQAIIQTAQKLGIDPVDLATAIAYETGGTFDPKKLGPTTQWGQHFGLLQWGPKGAGKEYGVTPDSTGVQQMEAAARYLKDRGVEPGMGLKDIYSAINAGRVGLYDRSDANNGGAPGTVTDKVAGMAPWRKKAEAYLAGDLGDQVASQLNQLAPKTIDQADEGSPSYADQLRSLQAPTQVAQVPTVPRMGDTLQIPPVPEANVEPTFLDRLSTSGRDISKSLGDIAGGLPGEAVSQAVRLAGKIQGSVGSLPATMAGLGGAAIESGSELGLLPESGKGITKPILEHAQEMREAADQVYGISAKPNSPGEAIVDALGNSAPMAAAGPLIAGGGALADLTNQFLESSSGKAVTAQLNPFSSAMAEKRPFSKEELRKYRMEQDKLRAMGMIPETVPTGPMPPPYMQPQDLETTVPTAAGPSKLPKSTIYTLGTVGLLTFGAMAVPAMTRRVAQIGRQPTGSDVIIGPGDVAREYDAFGAGLLRAGRREGMDIVALKSVEDTMRIQSGAAANGMVRSAIDNGRMDLPQFSFNVKTPISKLKLVGQQEPEFLAYLEAKSIYGALLHKENQWAFSHKGLAPTNPIEFKDSAGVTHTTQSILPVINSMDRASPNFAQLANEYAANVKETRRFVYEGEYGLIPKSDYSAMNRDMPFTPVMTRPATGRLQKEMLNNVDQISFAEPSMENAMRLRMKNEIRGLYIDELKKVNPNVLEQITREEAKALRQRDYVKTYRRGEVEYHTSKDMGLMDILNQDPYHFTGAASRSAYAVKRAFEWSTTGSGNPGFAFTDAIRSAAQAQFTIIGTGLKRAGPVSYAKALPMQLYPQFAKGFSDAVDKGSLGWFGAVIGPQNLDALGTRMAQAYESSLYAQMMHAGNYRGQHMQQAQMIARNQIKAAGEYVPDWLKATWHTYTNSLDSVHNWANFATAVRNRGMDPSQLALKVRNLTGDPTVKGQYYRGPDASDTFRMNRERPLDPYLYGAAKMYGFGTEIGRNIGPWWNIINQSVKSTANVYWEHPIKFMGMLWSAQLLPEAMSYMWTRAMGPEYVNYKMDYRSPYLQATSMYIPVWGKRPEEGIELPLRPQEMSVGPALMSHGLDQLYGRSHFTPAEDFWHAMAGFMQVAFKPPETPLWNLPLATQDIVAPEGMFGDTFKRKSDPFDQYGGAPGKIESSIRALVPGIGNIILDGYRAFRQPGQDDESMYSGNNVKSALGAMSKRIKDSTPVVRDIIGHQQPMTGNSRAMEEIRNKTASLEQLIAFYKTNTAESGGAKAGQVRTRPISKAGGKIVQELLGDGPPMEGAGLSVKKPTNPLYNEFMQQVYSKFQQDAKGGLGYKSLWARYGDYSEQLRRVSKVNGGNAAAWQVSLGQNPEQLAYLKKNNVDYTNPRSVVNFYQQKKNEVALVLMHTIRKVEADLSQQVGKRIKLEDLDPYKQ